MTCPFCNTDKEKSRMIKNGKSVFVILSNPRLVAGHLLVIPKRHVEKLSELAGEERKELFDTAIEFKNKIAKAFSGCDMRQHYRPFIKESQTKVNHVHFHLHPRNPEDQLYKKSQLFEKDLFKGLTKSEIEKYTRLYR